jgi:hypothetical protein
MNEALSFILCSEESWYVNNEHCWISFHNNNTGVVRVLYYIFGNIANYIES